jgi:predicted dehydrogenase
MAEIGSFQGSFTTMRRVRIGIIGTGALTEGAILPALSGADATSPLDNGAWWTRRSSAQADIHYQAPARPEILALADSDQAQCTRVAQAARVRGVYTDWRRMVRETPLDVLICAAPVETNLQVLSTLALGGLQHEISWMWVSGPPAATVAQSLELSRLATPFRVWCARPLLQAAAHRAARRLMDRGEVGPVSALNLRWPAPFFAAADGTAAPYALASNYAALDLMMAFATVPPPRGSDAKPEESNREVGQPVQQVMAWSHGGATSVLLRFHSGVSATALFAAAEEWSAPWPRLEICGTEGRSLLCEGGREVRLLAPREPALVLTPPGASPTVSASNVLGVAEELKRFLLRWSETTSSTEPEGAGVHNDPALRRAAAVLQVGESLQQSLLSGRASDVPSLDGESMARPPGIMPAGTLSLF